ncbi:MAG: HAD-IB family phosphatase [Candidatus Thermoplasmatota archaeon]|jgi:phosphoserine phosphatase|nr:HAD-IB family phosphatase [Candidatus Thermoplasmatota archaeon]
MDQKCRYHCYRRTRGFNSVNKKKPGKIKLVVFDMDGVLTDTISSWRYVHDFFGSSNDRSVDAYLRGEIDDLEFIRRDVSLWRVDGKPVSFDMLVEILSGVPLMRGARECIGSLREHGVKTAIVSAGLDILARRVASKTGIDYVFANGLKTDRNGFVTGEGLLNVRLMYKEKSVRRLSELSKVPLGDFVAVGNSCFDIPMFEVCGVGIAFNPGDDCVRKAADYVVESRDLTKVLPFIERFL